MEEVSKKDQVSNKIKARSNKMSWFLNAKKKSIMNPKIWLFDIWYAKINMLKAKEYNSKMTRKKEKQFKIFFRKVFFKNSIKYLQYCQIYS